MKVELLAPAGSYEALEAAFEAGADGRSEIWSSCLC